jgi:TRAP-type C4-dicarboxylate transport system permease small subunit
LPVDSPGREKGELKGVEMTQQVQWFTRFRAAILKISKGMVLASCVMLAVILFFSVADVAGRELFLHPIYGTYEIVSMAFVICGAFAIGYTQLVKGHIQINIISDRLSPRGRSILFLFSYLASITGSTLVAWQGWLRMVVYFHKSLGSETVTLGMPLWPFMLIFSFGFFWLSIVLLFDIYESVIGAFKG